MHIPLFRRGMTLPKITVCQSYCWAGYPAETCLMRRRRREIPHNRDFPPTIRTRQINHRDGRKDEDDGH